MAQVSTTHPAASVASGGMPSVGAGAAPQNTPSLYTPAAPTPDTLAALPTPAAGMQSRY